jgi:hypothetical protein
LPNPLQDFVADCWPAIADDLTPTRWAEVFLDSRLAVDELAQEK